MSRVEQQSLMFEALEIRGKHYKSNHNSPQKIHADTTGYKEKIQKIDLKNQTIKQDKILRENNQSEKTYEIKVKAVEDARNLCEYKLNWGSYDKMEKWAGGQSDINGQRCHYVSKGYTKNYCYTCFQILSDAEKQIKELY